MIGEPAALLLDEPTNGLDDNGAAGLIELIAAAVHRDVAILIATHDLALVRATGAKTLRLSDGRVAEDLGEVNATDEAD